jgi:hypothetical protein
MQKRRLPTALELARAFDEETSSGPKNIILSAGGSVEGVPEGGGSRDKFLRRVEHAELDPDLDTPI